MVGCSRRLKTSAIRSPIDSTNETNKNSGLQRAEKHQYKYWHSKSTKCGLGITFQLKTWLVFHQTFPLCCACLSVTPKHNSLVTYLVCTNSLMLVVYMNNPATRMVKPSWTLRMPYTLRMNPATFGEINIISIEKIHIKV